MGAVLLWALVALLSAVLSLGAIAWLVLRLPEDYFALEDHPLRRASPHPALHLGKNFLGALLVLLGLVLSIPGVPGQGLLTILVGLFLSDFPGKYRLERAIVRREGVLRAANRLRARSGLPPFHLG